MGFFDALCSPDSHWEKIRDEASRIVYGRLRSLRLAALDLPTEVMDSSGYNCQLEDDLRAVLAVYFSSCVVFLNRFMLRPPGRGLQDYYRRIKQLGPQSVIDLAAACHLHYIFTYGDFADPYQSSAGFLMHGAAFAYGKTGAYTNLWVRARIFNEDPIEQLNDRLGEEFAVTLGVNRFNTVEMVDVCSMADAINGYVAKLCADPANLSSFAELVMKIPFGH